MAFWHKKKNWEDEYDEYYAQDRRAEPKKGPGNFRFVPHVLLLAFLGALFIGAAGLISGPTMVEKLLTSLAMPIGIVWVALIFLVYFCMLLRQTWPALVGLICWLVLTVGGNSMFANLLANSLESEFQDIKLSELAPFDYVVLLGGGTTTNLNGRPQTSTDGDRVVVAARMFHASQAKKIICTGSQPFLSSPDMHPREESAEILTSLNVPQEAIYQMKGNNTSEEMANLKTWLEQNHHPVEGSDSAAPRIGILTSAWHLKRSLRLAQSNGLEVHPIPASFMSGPFSPSPGMVVPSGENLSVSSRMIKEYLARTVGR